MGRPRTGYPAGSFWSKAKRAAAAADRALGMAEAVLIVLLLAGAAALNFFQVASRYLLEVSASSLEEISVYLILWMVFVGAARADRLERNIALDILHGYLGQGMARGLWRLCDALLAVTALWLAAAAVEAVHFSRFIGETSVSSLSAPIWVVMLVMPLSFLAIGCRAAGRVVTGRRRSGGFDAVDLQA